MASLFANRVYETCASASTGTGNFTLGGAVTGYRTFSAAFGTNQAYYLIVNRSAPGEWEIGLFTVNGTTLARSTATIIDSSNAGALVSFTAGIKDVYNIAPASLMQNWQSTSAQTSGASVLQNHLLSCLTSAMSGGWAAGTVSSGAYDAFNSDTLSGVSGTTGAGYDSVNKLYSSQVNALDTSGTAFGNNSSGTLANTYNGTRDAASSSPGWGSNPAYIGRIYSSARQLTRCTILSPSDNNFSTGSPRIYTYQLEGSNNTLTGVDGTWTAITTSTTHTEPNYPTPTSVDITSGISTTAYKAYRFNNTSTGNYAQSLYVGEASFYTLVAGSAMTLVSPALSPAPSSAPTQINIMFLYKDVSGTAVLNTDVTVEATRTGAAWAAGALAETGITIAGFKVLWATADVSGQASATTVQVRIKTLNSKVQQVKGLAFTAQ